MVDAARYEPWTSLIFYTVLLVSISIFLPPYNIKSDVMPESIRRVRLDPEVSAAIHSAIAATGGNPDDPQAARRWLSTALPRLLASNPADRHQAIIERIDCVDRRVTSLCEVLVTVLRGVEAGRSEQRSVLASVENLLEGGFAALDLRLSDLAQFSSDT